MKKNNIPLLPFTEITNKNFPETFPVHLKSDRNFIINCKKALKQSKKNLPKLPNIAQNIKLPSTNRVAAQSDRPNRIKFIKEVKKQISMGDNRRKVISTANHLSRKTANESKQNTQSLRNIPKLQKVYRQFKGSSEYQRVLVSEPSQEIKESPCKMPPCKVGRVRYRAISKSPINFWDKITLSQIQIKEDNDEEIATLQRIQLQLNGY